MRTVRLVVLLRVALLVAIAASAALVIEYQNAGDPAFCGTGSACFQVRVSEQSQAVREVLNVNLPQLGLAVYVGLLGASLMARARLHHWMIAGISGVGALVAVYLLYAQKFEIGAICPWCAAVDVSAIVVAGAGLAIAQRASGPRTPVEERDELWSRLSGGSRIAVAWAAAGALAIGLPFLWGSYPVIPPPAPEIRALRVPGKVTYIEFTDFQCPFCRKLHPVLESLCKEYDGRIELSRRMKPLSGHPGALPAALGYLCAPPDRQEAMADALYSAPPEELTAAGVAAIAVKVGLAPADFAACIESPETKRRLDEDGELYEKIGPRGLPLSFIDDRVIVGFDEAKIRRAVSLEASGGRAGLPVTGMFVALAVVIAAAAGFTWSQARGPTSRPKGERPDPASPAEKPDTDPD